MIDPARSTVVAWYDVLPDDLAELVARLQAAAVACLGTACRLRHPDQVHATLIGLEHQFLARGRLVPGAAALGHVSDPAPQLDRAGANLSSGDLHWL